MDIEKSCPQGQLSSGGFQQGFSKLYESRGLEEIPVAFYCSKNFISVFLSRHQGAGFLIWPCDPVVKLDAQAQSCTKATAQLTIVW